VESESNDVTGYEAFAAYFADDSLDAFMLLQELRIVDRLESYARPSPDAMLADMDVEVRR
jgi:hypothetical protein